MRSGRRETGRGELPAIPRRLARLEPCVVAFELVLGGEGFQERYPAAQLRQTRKAATQFGARQVMHDVAAYQQVDRRAGTQEFEIAEAGVMQVAGAAVARNRVFAAVEAQVAQLRPQLQQRRAPRAFAAADVQHAADRALQPVLGRGHCQRHLARQPLRAADVAAAVPALEVGGVILFGHAM